VPSNSLTPILAKKRRKLVRTPSFAKHRPLHPGIRSPVRAYVPESEHLPNNGEQRSHHQPWANWVYEVENQQRPGTGNKSRRHEEHQKTQQAKHSVLPDTSYRKPEEEGRQHSCECTRSHRKQPKNEIKENREAGRHRLRLALSNEDLARGAVQSFVGVKSRLRSMNAILANKQRKLARTPGYITYLEFQLVDV
jgi:hypothetical protein